MTYPTTDLTKWGVTSGSPALTRSGGIEVIARFRTKAEAKTYARSIRDKTWGRPEVISMKQTPDCGGPDCKMVEHHPVDTCPKYSDLEDWYEL